VSFVSLELFAGAGGLGIGLSQAGFHPIEVVEFNRWCCDTLRENLSAFGSPFETTRVFEGDVRSVDFSRHAEKVDLISGGRHRAHADLRDMFPEAVRAVREAMPKAFIFENVKGLMRASFKNYFQYISLQLEHPEITAKCDEDWTDHLGRLEQHHTSRRRTGLNYRVVSRLLNAANYGVPQRRDRVVFVGFRDDVNARWSFPDAEYTQDALVWDQVFGDYWDRHNVAHRDRVLESKALQMSRRLSKDEKPTSVPWRTTREALKGLPKPTKSVSNRFDNHILQEGARCYPGHTGSYVDEPAKTLKAGVHGVPGGENMLRRADGTVRYFTVRESARIQTFPDDFRLHGAWSECMRQLGNAVPVELARRVGLSIAEKLKVAA
jgi:DNA (cytosine-5)-methyltransferase 1